MSFHFSVSSVQTTMTNAQTLPTHISSNSTQTMTSTTISSIRINSDDNLLKTAAEVNVNFALRPPNNACLAATATTGNLIVKKSAITGIGELVEVVEEVGTISHIMPVECLTILPTKFLPQISTMISNRPINSSSLAVTAMAAAI